MHGSDLGAFRVGVGKSKGCLVNNGLFVAETSQRVGVTKNYETFKTRLTY